MAQFEEAVYDLAIPVGRLRGKPPAPDVGTDGVGGGRSTGWRCALYASCGTTWGAEAGPHQQKEGPAITQVPFL